MTVLSNIIVKNLGQQGFLLPKFKMSTPVLSEEGMISIHEDGVVRWEIKNLSKMMKMKLKIAILLI